MAANPRSVPYQAPTPIRINGIETVYDIFGHAADPPLVLVAGLGMQMIGWDEKLCAQLAGNGYRVIRFDNRDTGLATKFTAAGVPDVGRLVQARLQGIVPQEPLPYTAYDMVADTIALFDELDLDQVHLLGISMGGIIAQLLTIEHPERVKTLMPVLTTTGAAELPLPRPEALAVFMRPPAQSRAEYIENSLQGWRILSGSAYPLDEEETRLRAGRNYDRCYEPTGTTRQLAATVALESLRPKLERIAVPTLVIHGDEDPLFPIECGRDIAKSIPGAKMLVMEGVGHALPPEIWPQLVGVIANHGLESDKKPGFSGS